MVSKKEEEERRKRLLPLFFIGGAAVLGIGAYLLTRDKTPGITNPPIQPPPPGAIPNEGTFCVASNPPGATLRVFGYEQTTPACLIMAPGTYSYEVFKAGFEREEGMVTIFAGQTQNIIVNLQGGGTTGHVCFSTDQDPATFWIEGLGNFTSPFCLDLDAGSYNYAVIKPGFEVIANTSFVLFGGESQLDIFRTLTPTGPNGTVLLKTLNCCPACCPENPLPGSYSIPYLGLTGTTPNTISLPPGNHRVWYTPNVPGFLPTMQIFTITSGMMTTATGIFGLDPGLNDQIDFTHSPTIPGVNTNLSRDDGSGYQFFGNSPGTFWFPPGNYDVQIDDGTIPTKCFDTETITGINVVGGGMQSFNFNLNYHPDDFQLVFSSTVVTTLEGTPFNVDFTIRRIHGCDNFSAVMRAELRDNMGSVVSTTLGSPVLGTWLAGTLSQDDFTTGPMTMRGIAPPGLYGIYVVIEDAMGGVLWDAPAGQHLVTSPIPPPATCQLMNFADFDAVHTGIVRWGCWDTACMILFCQTFGHLCGMWELEVDYSNPVVHYDSGFSSSGPKPNRSCAEAVESWIYGLGDVEFVACPATGTWWGVVYNAQLFCNGIPVPALPLP